MADYHDPANFKGPVVIESTFDMSGSTLTPPTNQRLVKTLAIAFVIADIQAGTKSSASLPANALILGVHVSMTTPLAFSDGGTTGATCAIGNVDTDGFGTATQLSGAAGIRRPAAGALSGSVVAGSTDGAVLTFVATGAAPQLANISAGAGTAYVHYVDLT